MVRRAVSRYRFMLLRKLEIDNFQFSHYLEGITLSLNSYPLVLYITSQVSYVLLAVQISHIPWAFFFADSIPKNWRVIVLAASSVEL